LKARIAFIDDLLYIYNSVIIKLNNTAPDTQSILRSLAKDERLKKYDIYHLEDYCLLDDKNKAIVAESIDTLGKYDIKTQINCFNEYAEYFKGIKAQKEAKLSADSKLYLVLSLSAGSVISLLLM
jgi:hypothetical protein